MLHVITGGAGFISVNLIPRLLALGHKVVALDNLSRGKAEYLDAYCKSGSVRFLRVDCSDPVAMRAAFQEAFALGVVSEVWHLAANSDIPAGVLDPHVDLKDTFMSTFTTLAVMKEFNVKVIHFASSSAIYGDFGSLAIAEDTAPYRPISNYGAMKLASEAQISAFAESVLTKADIFRFPNVVGVPATHGVVIDFIKKLEQVPDRLDVLGNGTQQKAYIHVHDLVDAMLFIADKGPDRVNIFNIGSADEGVTVRFIAETIRDLVNPAATIHYGNEDRGWVGDVPKFRYVVDRLAKLGWRPSLDSSQALQRAARDIVAQELSF